MLLVAQRVLLAGSGSRRDVQALNADLGTGASAFGTGSGSVNGERISGLVGKFSM